MRIACRIGIAVAALAAASCHDIARAQESVLMQQLFEMRTAIDKYHADSSELPPTLDALVAKDYLNAVPIDPMTDSASTWRLTRTGHRPPYPAGATGVSDVHSGSDRVSPLNRTKYSDW
jgi:general secretion pathway protein G